MGCLPWRLTAHGRARSLCALSCPSVIQLADKEKARQRGAGEPDGQRGSSWGRNVSAPLVQDVEAPCKPRKGIFLMPNRNFADLDFAELHRILRYDPDTGAFYRLVPSRNGCYKPGSRGSCGSRADYRTKNNYGKYPVHWVCIKGKPYQAHRLAWFYMTGEWPKYLIDHIDNEGSNNAWRNLREATRITNAHNAKRHKDNSTGYKGVCKITEHIFMAAIQVNGKRIHLGKYKSALEAHEVYCIAAKRYFGEFARYA